MPSDPILESLCTEGIARKAIRPVPSSTPQHPYKSLGARHDTVFYNTATQYTMDFWIHADTVVLVKNDAGDFLKASKDALARIYYLLLNLKQGGASFSVPGGSGGGSGSSSRHLKHIDYYDMEIFMKIIGLFRPAPGRSIFHYLSALSNLKDGAEEIFGKTGKDPYIPGQGPLKPEEISQDKLDEYAEKYRNKEQKRDTIRVPVKPNPYPIGNTPSSDIIQTQHVRMEVTVESAQDTIRLANRDSSSIMNVVREVSNMANRDTIYKTVYVGREAIQYEKLIRQDTIYYINIHLTQERIIYKDHITGETISKERYDEIKRSE